MKHVIKRTFAVTLALCFILAFSFSAGAVDAIGDVIENLDKGDFGDVVEYDYINKTERIISKDEIFDYASLITTTYELERMESELARLTEMNANMDDGVSTFSFVNPNEPYTLSPPVVNGVYQAPASGTVLLVLGIDEDGQGDTDRYERGTGFMVSPNVMVTAGHCIKWRTAGETVVEVRVYPFYHGTPRPDKTDAYFVYPLNWQISSNYPSDVSEDWCIMTLQQSIPNAYNVPCSYTRVSENVSVHITGYPQLNGNCDDCYQRRSTGEVALLSSKYLKHTCNTAGGSSGSPICVLDIAFPNVCIGIHTRGADSNNRNYGVRITESLFNKICDKINNS